MPTQLTQSRGLIKGGVFEKVSLGPWVDFPEGGSERTIEMTYKGHPVRIVFAWKRSGPEYYREESLRGADLVVIHDPGVGNLDESFDLLARMLVQKGEKFPEKNQMIIMEGSSLRDSEQAVHFPPGMRLEELEGPYGHCGEKMSLAEIEFCTYRTAKAFLMNDPALQALVSQKATGGTLEEDVNRLSWALFTPPPGVHMSIPQR